MLSALNIVICVVCSVACGCLAPLVIQRIEKGKAERYGKALPYDAWPVGRTVFLCFAFTGCSILCILSLDVLQAIIACALLFTGVSCALIDVDMRLIPNEIVGVIVVLGIALRASCGLTSLLYGLAAAAVAFLFLLISILVSKALFGRIGMGAGDFKLLIAASLATGWPGAVFMVVGYSVAVVAMVLYQVIYLRLGLKSMFPMAPAIVAGLICGTVYQAIPGVAGMAPV